MSDYRELLLGCGHARDKRIVPPVTPSWVTAREWQNLTTLDENPRCKPDILCDLEILYDGCWHMGPGPDLDDDTFLELVCEGNWALSFKSDLFDEVHAYEVLEHLGSQGDAVSFFSHFAEIWRILKPDGYLCATVPSRYSPWLWGDPSHRRLINEESLSFLDQDNYKQLDGPKPTPMSDFRTIYKADFRIIERQDNHKQFFFILQAVKPSRVRKRIP